MHSQEASCCQTLTEGPAVIGKTKGNAINALQIGEEKSCLTVSSALACVAKELIQVILPLPIGQRQITRHSGHATETYLASMLAALQLQDPFKSRLQVTVPAGAACKGRPATFPKVATIFD